MEPDTSIRKVSRYLTVENGSGILNVHKLGVSVANFVGCFTVNKSTIHWNSMRENVQENCLWRSEASRHETRGQFN